MRAASGADRALVALAFAADGQLVGGGLSYGGPIEPGATTEVRVPLAAWQPATRVELYPTGGVLR